MICCKSVMIFCDQTTNDLQWSALISCNQISCEVQTWTRQKSIFFVTPCILWYTFLNVCDSLFFWIFVINIFEYIREITFSLFTTYSITRYKAMQYNIGFYLSSYRLQMDKTCRTKLYISQVIKIYVKDDCTSSSVRQVLHWFGLFWKRFYQEEFFSLLRSVNRSSLK